MSRLFVESASDYLEAASAPVTGYPLTVSCWCYPTSFPAAGTVLCSVLTSGSGNHRFVLALSPTNGAPEFVARTTSAATATASANATTGQWNHMAGVGASATSRAVLLNGGSKGTNATSNTPSGMNRARIGLSSTGTSPANGRIAEVTIWNVALSDDEVGALARGILPWQVRPESICGYWPLYGMDSPEPDLSFNNRPMTVNGSPARADHAPIVKPTFVFVPSPAVSASRLSLLLSGVGH